MTVSPRLAQLIAEMNVCETESFNLKYKSDAAALDEFIALKRRLRRECGVVFTSDIPRSQRTIRCADDDFDSTFAGKQQAEGETHRLVERNSFPTPTPGK